MRGSACRDCDYVVSLVQHWLDQGKLRWLFLPVSSIMSEKSCCLDAAHCLHTKPLIKVLHQEKAY